jgi:hypothetical protein
VASFQKESGTAKGRGFGTVDGVPSFMNRLKTWIVKNAVSGGPAWYIIDDQSALSTAPYIVISDKATLSNSNRNKVIQIYVPNASGATSDRIYVAYWMYWNTTTHTGVSKYAEHRINTEDTNEYAYDFRGGPEALLLMTRTLGGTWTWTFIDEWEGISNLVEAESGHTGTLTANWPTEANDGSNQLSGYEALTGVGPNLDANGKLYFSITVSGSNIGLNIYKDSARTQLIGSIASANYTAGQFQTVTAQNSSGLGGSIRFDAKTVTDTDIEVDFAVQLGTGEGAGLTPGEFYYIWDFQDNTLRLNYVKVLTVVSDKVTLDGIQTDTTQGAFKTGAIISPYGHRWIVLGSNTASGNGNLNQIPYFSAYQLGILAMSDGFASNTSASYSTNNFLVRLMNPDDKGRYAVMKCIAAEASDRNGLSYASIPGTSAQALQKPNRAYGQIKNFYYSSDRGLSQMLAGRTIDSKNYICFATSIVGSDALLFLDTTALS